MCLLCSAPGGAELFDGAGQSLGEFDLVVDAMGLHSTLRLHRMHDAADGKQFTGTINIHGVINDPDAVCSKALVRRLRSYGTAGCFGRGFSIGLQRFGAGEHDNRTSVFYALSHLDGDEALFREIGISAPESRAAGIMSDERLGKVKAWVLRDMGEQFDPAWRNAIERLDRVTVRAEVTHGDSKLRDDVALPLVCIGDSQRNCGLGGGGNLAMQDAIELSKLLEAAGAFDAAGRPVLAPIRAAEAVMIERKQSFHEKKQGRVRAMHSRIETEGRGESSLADFGLTGWKLVLARFFLPRVGRLLSAWFRWEERRYGRVGSDASTPYV